MTDFTAETWFSRAGDWHSEELRVTERFTPAGNLNDMFVLLYEATIEDPNVFTRNLRATNHRYLLCPRYDWCHKFIYKTSETGH